MNLASASSPNLVVSKRRKTFSQYDAINDPHLKDYFERKFKLSSAVSVC